MAASSRTIYNKGETTIVHLVSYTLFEGSTIIALLMVCTALQFDVQINKKYNAEYSNRSM